MATGSGTGRATASCGSCGHVWTVPADEDPKECPDCGWKGAITVSIRRLQRQKRKDF